MEINNSLQEFHCRIFIDNLYYSIPTIIGIYWRINFLAAYCLAYILDFFFWKKYMEKIDLSRLQIQVEVYHRKLL